MYQLNDLTFSHFIVSNASCIVMIQNKVSSLRVVVREYQLSKSTFNHLMADTASNPSSGDDPEQGVKPKVSVT